jgi:hypothetical protein
MIIKKGVREREIDLLTTSQAPPKQKFASVMQAVPRSASAVERGVWLSQSSVLPDGLQQDQHYVHLVYESDGSQEGEDPL